MQNALKKRKEKGYAAKFHKKKTGKRNIKKIKELADMKELGIITEEEFETKKKQLLEL